MSSDSPIDAQPDLPRKLGKYVLKRELGSGATSTVYLADDPFHVREVAVKVIRWQADGSSERDLADASLRTEAMLLGKLNHPHIVKVFDVVNDGEGHYVVMELVGGGSMERYTRRGYLLEFPKAVDAVFKCAKALQYMNGLGLIHRDIKPANILLTLLGDVRLSDLGATLLSGDEGQHSLNAGTPFYMSPEQLLERPLEFRSDMFSLGVVFYELLTGEKPFDALNVNELIFQYVHHTPRPPSTLRPSLPVEVDAVVSRMLGCLPSERYADWEDCLDALSAIPAHHTDLASSIGYASAAEKFRLLRDSPFFRAFSDADLWYVVEIGRFMRIHADEVLIREGDPGGFFLIVLSGMVRISKAGRTIDVIADGTSLGEISYVLEGRVRRNTTCTAEKDGIVLRIEDAVLRGASDICRSRFEKTFLHAMASWLVEADQRLAGRH
ncbi:MAG: protein kinase [Betaproteobacteria bacterium]|nr:protein kinase [Betaproteobacteria bacterium]